VSATDNATISRVTAIVAPLLVDLKLDLYDVEFRGGTLRVTVDTPPGSPGGVDLDTIALVTRMVSRDLDHADPIPGRYTLEVTSPGLERTLRTPAHFRR
jgi:ribosome maturation factor RimP